MLYLQAHYIPQRLPRGLDTTVVCFWQLIACKPAKAALPFLFHIEFYLALPTLASPTSISRASRKLRLLKKCKIPRGSCLTFFLILVAHLGAGVGRIYASCRLFSLYESIPITIKRKSPYWMIEIIVPGGKRHYSKYVEMLHLNVIKFLGRRIVCSCDPVKFTAWSCRITFRYCSDNTIYPIKADVSFPIAYLIYLISRKRAPSSPL